MTLTIFLRMAIISYVSPESSFADLRFGVCAALFALASFLNGWIIGWYETIVKAARKVKERCRMMDVEKTGYEQEELRWWIEAVTKRETHTTTPEKESTVKEIGEKMEKKQEIVVTCVEVSNHSISNPRNRSKATSRPLLGIEISCFQDIFQSVLE